MDEWVRWDLKDCFRVQIPAEAKTRLDDDGTTAVIRVGSPGAVTEVLLSNYPLESGKAEEADPIDALRGILTAFFDRAFLEAFGHAVPCHVEPVEDPDLEVSCAQGVAVLQNPTEAVWVARAYARPGGSRFWLMHWNGPKDNLELVMRIFVSFEPAETSFR